MPIDSEHSALGRWILKKLFKIDIDDLASEQRSSLALLDAANKHKTQFDAAVAAKEAQISDLLQQIEASKADLSYAAREIDQLKQEHEAKQHALDSLESEKANLQSKNDHLEALIKELEITIKQREAELAEAKSKLESQQTDTAKKEKQIAGLKGDIEGFMKLKKQLTSENAKLEGKSGRLSKVTKDLMKMLEDSKLEVDGLKIERRALKEELEKYKRCIDQLQQELKDQSNKSEHDAQIAKLEELVKTLRLSVESRDKKIEGLEAKHEILSSRLKDVIQQHDECQHLLREANKEKKELENRLAELQKCTKYEK